MPEYQQGSGALLPAELHKFIVNDAKDDTSESSGNEMIVLEEMIIGKNGADDITLNDYLVFSPGGIRKIDEFRIATGEKLQPGLTVSFDAEDARELNGKRREGLVMLKIEPYQGRQYNKVDYYPDPELIDPQIKAELLGKGSLGPKQSPASATAPEDTSKDDLNFGTVPAGS